jgi:hypothetical protein
MFRKAVGGCLKIKGCAVRFRPLSAILRSLIIIIIIIMETN